MALRLRRIFSTEFFNTRSGALTTHLIKRGYKRRFVKDAMEKVRQIPRSTAVETSISSSYIVPPLQKPTWHAGQGQTPQASPSASGAFSCHRNRCKTCPYITEGTTSYTFFSTNEQRRIRHHITCSSSNLVYMIDTVQQMQRPIYRRD